MPALEAALARLVRRAFEAPATLVPDDLAPLREACGDSALVYATVLGAFHYVNRIADLLHVDSEFLPGPLLRYPRVRRVAVRLGSLLLGRMDLASRRYDATFEQACERYAPAFVRATGREPARDLEVLRPRPWLVEILGHSLEERQQRSTLTAAQMERVHRVVEDALPRRVDQVEGFHPRPADPFDDFVFVGTRYAARATPAMIGALREAGFDDLGILDLAHAVADANQWARTWRLFGLDPAILTPSGGCGEAGGR